MPTVQLFQSLRWQIEGKSKGVFLLALMQHVCDIPLTHVVCGDKTMCNNGKWVHETAQESSDPRYHKMKTRKPHFVVRSPDPAALVWNSSQAHSGVAA